jgi:mRNA interferase MazF
VPKPFLKSGAFDAQGIISVAVPRLIRKLGDLQTSELALVEDAVKKWLGF